MTPYSSGQGLNSTVVTANTAGTQIAIVGAQAATSAGAAAMAGFLHTVSFGGDTTANTIAIYDGTSTAGKLVYQATAAANLVQSIMVDVQLKVGLFYTLTTGTTPAITITWA